MLRRPPCPALRPYVHTVWARERGALAHARERLLPSGSADLVLALHDGGLTRYGHPGSLEGDVFVQGVLQGPRDQACIRDTSTPVSVVGVQFRPAGLAAFVGCPVSELGGLTLDPSELWGHARVHTLRERLHATPTAHERLDRLEAFLCAQMARIGAAPQAWVHAALDRLHQARGQMRIDALLSDGGASPRALAQAFRRAVGLSPKRYAQVLRLTSLIDTLPRARAVDWAQTAVAAGFADQAHLVHAFRKHTGLTPSQYRPVTADQALHVACPPERQICTRHADGDGAR
jgi:AraC-like DNA-binding protein